MGSGSTLPVNMPVDIDFDGHIDGHWHFDVVYINLKPKIIDNNIKRSTVYIFELAENH